MNIRNPRWTIEAAKLKRPPIITDTPMTRQRIIKKALIICFSRGYGYTLCPKEAIPLEEGLYNKIVRGLTSCLNDFGWPYGHEFTESQTASILKGKGYYPLRLNDQPDPVIERMIKPEPQQVPEIPPVPPVKLRIEPQPTPSPAPPPPAAPAREPLPEPPPGYNGNHEPPPEPPPIPEPHPSLPVKKKSQTGIIIIAARLALLLWSN